MNKLTNANFEHGFRDLGNEFFHDPVESDPFLDATVWFLVSLWVAIYLASSLNPL